MVSLNPKSATLITNPESILEEIRLYQRIQHTSEEALLYSELSIAPLEQNLHAVSCSKVSMYESLAGQILHAFSNLNTHVHKLLPNSSLHIND